jgi:hypothetical protein
MRNNNNPQNRNNNIGFRCASIQFGLAGILFFKEKGSELVFESRFCSCVCCGKHAEQIRKRLKRGE